MDNMNVMFSGESIDFKSALVSGKVDDNSETPTSIYGGPLNLEEIHSALFYANRAVIKLLIEEFSVPLDAVDEFLLSALSEAVTQEWNAQKSGTPDMDIRKIIKHRRNQN